ncbi:MAG TPA: nucleotide-binding protein [Stellaceae bacterium]|nr:nucleotide-binding protein [Stellaceae bacterium]
MWTNVEGFKAELRKWRDFNYELLQTLFTTKGPADEFRHAAFPSHVALNESEAFRLSLEGLAKQIITLESIQERLGLYRVGNDSGGSILADGVTIQATLDASKVFIVHGHDAAARHGAARFVEQLGLTAIILEEQPNKGRTTIEKLTANSDVGFAIVLLTGDDIGTQKGSPSETHSRARQNVILELGYFVGKLGRERVCPLYEEGIELPSDYHGVVYVPLDKQDAWKLRLAKEMKAAGLPVDLNKAI